VQNTEDLKTLRGKNLNFKPLNVLSEGFICSRMRVGKSKNFILENVIFVALNFITQPSLKKESCISLHKIEAAPIYFLPLY